ncbi:hypothetical protein U9M48_041800 [Paspalum notatum var. saurae]|uniref:Uncharacterized protein n=1 Tax=Paspalum notatum var. saurae TaxID=547442 RepID=A0AAQ3UTS8_PASNO
MTNDDPVDDENPINDNKRAQMIGTVLVPEHSITVTFALQIDNIITQASYGPLLGEQHSMVVPS